MANEARRVISSQLKHRTAPYLASQFKLIADAVRGVPIVDTQMIQDINRRFETFLGKKGLTAENIHAAQSVVQPAILQEIEETIKSLDAVGVIERKRKETEK